MRRSENEYYDRAVLWYETHAAYNRVPLAKWHSISCTCRKCLQADFNAAQYSHGMLVAVEGL